MDEERVKTRFGLNKSQYGITFNAKGVQLQIVMHVLNGQSVLGLLPTGFGKTMCILMPSMITETESITLIVSPLVALMDDMAEKIKGYGISVAKLEPMDSMDKTVIDGVKNGHFQIVITSPETALKSFWKNVFLSDVWQQRILLLAIDEAHCISEWGEDFRTDYRLLHELRSLLDCPVLALTATTTAKVKGDIIKFLHLDIQETKVVSKKPDRPNIFVEVQKLSIRGHMESLKWLTDHIRNKQELSKKTIVFCRGVDTVSDIFTQMRVQLGNSAYVSGIKDSKHVLVEMFHKCTDIDSKQRILGSFKNNSNNIRCLIATTALGMGLDIPDVDVVVHVGCPKSVLSYWQEVGRCARNGEKGYAIALCDTFSLSRKNTGDDIREIVNNCTTSCCRDRLMQQFEGDPDTKDEVSCGQCTRDDVCLCTLCNCCAFCRSTCPCQDVIGMNVEKFLAV